MGNVHKISCMIKGENVFTKGMPTMERGFLTAIVTKILNKVTKVVGYDLLAGLF